MKLYNKKDLEKFPQRERARFINSLSGFKSANLIGTIDPLDQTNLAIVSSVIHLGSRPPLMGMIMRPHKTSRHTLENIQATGFYTINHVPKEHYKQAHQTAAKYARTESEFASCGFTPEFVDGFVAPAVAESRLQMGLELAETLSIERNGTILVIGEVCWVQVSQSAVLEDGYIDIEQLGTVAISGLDGYHTTDKLARLHYAQPDQPVAEINDSETET